MTPFAPTFDDLRQAMALEPFDGRAAQRLVEPAHRGAPPATQPHALRPAAALLYAFDRGGAVHFPLTRRASTLRYHGGQISLPGGRPEPGESLAETARREAREEVGLVGAHHELGWLTPVEIPVSGARLHVCVAQGPDPGQLVPEPAEVAHIGLATLTELVDPSRQVTRRLEIHQRVYDVEHFLLGGFAVWGATAMALAELAARLRSVRERP